ncbi:sugar ABC transporter ATP-binding protein [Burkholderia ubonensis]|uniref:sugar ABC transporter ATP-binding protein n=1 Tax=Burkholderia ubonensis TaxID=101571 RepID=UPI00075F60AE|nr:sugar ABC transporter ATP-binding protein [Burkholderia ubonensis]KVS39903.1 D-ribose transporter ATP-binding protein [Burkholderia ubonensis]KVS47998.1 D-ribose transporter ATP-binding protein [Burkholderia ubonensis]KVS78732.1 D-ribose transporter ATP-binding protein [Burkholderia ubonensis]KVS93467.1 D-ribose transporter ATP-binding protein [Burkholderia ubonensis]KVS94212.1 D-ribose transporter ATP-binding protein [Burkholderia ubonensis]
MGDTPILELRGIEKRFPGVIALQNMSFAVRRGSVHVICGENGAGKSTLMKIVSGIYQPDGGEIFVEGEKVTIDSPVTARRLKISMVTQELNYIPEITVAQSLFLGDEPRTRIGSIDWKKVYRDAKALLEREGLPYRPDTKLKDLSVSDLQMLEIMKAVSRDANIIIFDEPTSAITSKEVDILFKKIDQLRSRGAGIIYISHRFEELYRIADDISVIRDGTHVATRPATEIDIDTIIQMMVGRKLDNVYPQKPARNLGPTALEVKELGDDERFSGVNFNVRKGEIIGLAGLMGAGRTEVVRTVFGLDPYTTGEVRVHGEPVRIKSVQDAIRLKIAMLSEDRKRYGIVPMRSITENTGLVSLQKFFKRGHRNAKTEKRLIDGVSSRMKVKAPSFNTPIGLLSGGNQQKVMLAKWMLCDPDVLILDEPTRGIDVGAKFEIYKIIFELAEEGRAIVVISSELPELIAICDRIYVMAAGRIRGELHQNEFSQEGIMRLATMGGDEN